jgi:hypothetical protein
LTCTYLAKRIRELSSTKTEVILTNFFAEPTVLLVPITSRDHYKNPTKLVGRVQSGPHNHFIEN